MSRVHIKFLRVQTWLFEVPRLRAMLGANTLIGEVLRVGLPGLAKRRGIWRLTPASTNLPGAHALDPLAAHDDPAADAREGILARDGGHFEADFSEGAEAFVEAAAHYLRSALPGLRFRIWLDGVSEEGAQSDLSLELPVLAPCEWTGRGIASVVIRQGRDQASVSLDVSNRHGAALRAQQGAAHDLASLLTGQTRLRDLPRPSSFEALAGRGYLALIHADGNNVGRMASGQESASFFHRNRVYLRHAIRQAIDEVCADAATAPLLPLMLGGDDLLVACRAEVALPFVERLCDALAAVQSGSSTSGWSLTLGIGVVIARPNVPIHRLHAVAERLAVSAKRRYRGFAPNQGRSVVDWAVYTTTAVDEPEEVRRRDWVRGAQEERRVLSRRPLDVLGQGLDSLQGLLQGSKALLGAPRSPLRHLVDQLPRGRVMAELALAELSDEASKALKEAGIIAVWTRVDGTWLTSVLDLIEVHEIVRLGAAESGEVVGAEEDGEEGFDGEI